MKYRVTIERLEEEEGHPPYSVQHCGGSLATALGDAVIATRAPRVEQVLAELIDYLWDFGEGELASDEEDVERFAKAAGEIIDRWNKHDAEIR